MKILLFLLISLTSYSQRYAVKNISGIDYILKTDTTNGAIFCALIPSKNIEYDVYTLINDNEEELYKLNQQKKEIAKKELELNYQYRLLNEIIYKIASKK